MMKFPIYGKNKNVPNHQPEYVDLVVYPQLIVDNPGCEWTKLIHSTWNWGYNHGGRNSIQKLGLGYLIQKRW